MPATPNTRSSFCSRLRGWGRRQTVVREDGRGLSRRNAVSKLRKVSVAGVGERLFRGEGDVTLRMGASQVPFPGSVADVQVAPAKDGALGQHFVLLESSSQKKWLEDGSWCVALVGCVHRCQLSSALYIYHHANCRSARNAEVRAVCAVVCAARDRGDKRSRIES